MVVQQKPCIIHCLTVLIYLYKNLRFLTVSVSDIVEQLKKYIQSFIMSFDLVLSIFPKQLVTTYCIALILAFV